MLKYKFLKRKKVLWLDLACVPVPLPSPNACKVHLVSALMNLLNPFKIHTMTEIAAGVSTALIKCSSTFEPDFFERKSEFSFTPVVRVKKTFH